MKNTERKTYVRDYIRKRRSNEKLKSRDNQIRSHSMTNTEKTRENNRIRQRKHRGQNRSTKKGNELKRKSCQNVFRVEPKKQCMDVNSSFDPVDADINNIIQSFHRKISSGPEHFCLCCEQIWYKTSLKKFNANNYKSRNQNMLSKCNLIDKVTSDKHWICFTCDSHLRCGKITTPNHIEYKLLLICIFYLADLVGYVQVCTEIQKSSKSSNTFFDVHLQIAQEQTTVFRVMVRNTSFQNANHFLMPWLHKNQL